MANMLVRASLDFDHSSGEHCPFALVMSVPELPDANPADQGFVKHNTNVVIVSTPTVTIYAVTMKTLL